MLHNILFIRRHYPEHAGSIIWGLAAASASALLVGIGLLIR